MWFLNWKFCFFAFGYPVVPAPFVEKAILLLLNCFCRKQFFVRNQLGIFVCDIFVGFLFCSIDLYIYPFIIFSFNFYLWSSLKLYPSMHLYFSLGSYIFLKFRCQFTSYQLSLHLLNSFESVDYPWYIWYNNYIIMLNQFPLIRRCFPQGPWNWCPRHQFAHRKKLKGDILLKDCSKVWIMFSRVEFSLHKSNKSTQNFQRN